MTGVCKRKVVDIIYTRTSNEYGGVDIPTVDDYGRRLINAWIDGTTTNSWQYTLIPQILGAFRVYFCSNGKESWDWVKNTQVKIRGQYILR